MKEYVKLVKACWSPKLGFDDTWIFKAWSLSLMSAWDRHTFIQSQQQKERKKGIKASVKIGYSSLETPYSQEFFLTFP